MPFSISLPRSAKHLYSCHICHISPFWPFYLLNVVYLSIALSNTWTKNLADYTKDDVSPKVTKYNTFCDAFPNTVCLIWILRLSLSLDVITALGGNAHFLLKRCLIDGQGYHSDCSQMESFWKLHNWGDSRYGLLTFKNNCRLGNISAAVGGLFGRAGGCMGTLQWLYGDPCGRAGRGELFSAVGAGTTIVPPSLPGLPTTPPLT